MMKLFPRGVLCIAYLLHQVWWLWSPSDSWWAPPRARLKHRTRCKENLLKVAFLWFLKLCRGFIMPAKRGTTSTPTKKKQEESRSSQKKAKFDLQGEEQNSEPMSTMSARKLTDDSTPPAWFARFETRFDLLIKDIKDMQDGLNSHIESTEEKFKSVKDEVKSLWDKIDDLENRSRRNNLVLYNIPEKSENNPNDCVDFMIMLARDFIKINDKDMPKFQRAHRTPTGPPRQHKPRPIHMQFATYQEKISFRKAAVAVFKTTTYNGWKLFIQDDLSARIQKNRKELVPVLKKLREEGKRPFFVYPAVLKFWDNEELKVYTASA